MENFIAIFFLINLEKFIEGIKSVIFSNSYYVRSAPIVKIHKNMTEYVQNREFCRSTCLLLT